jgi:hypothetical protein
VAASVDVPIPFGLAVAGELAGLWYAPEVDTSFGSVFNETTAPGLHTRTTYVRPRVSVAWNYPDRGVLYGLSSSAVVSYGFHGAVAGGDFSFSRIEARWNVGLGLDPRSDPSVREPRHGQRSPVPQQRALLLQPTLGGADINDENVLRGYSNYRFRAPNLVAYELNYERAIIDPIGIRIFGQLGKVGQHFSDLGFDRLKSSVGASLTFRLGGAAIAEISFGWSDAEGLHVYGTGNTNNLAPRGLHRRAHASPPRRTLYSLRRGASHAFGSAFSILASARIWRRARGSLRVHHRFALGEGGHPLRERGAGAVARDGRQHVVHGPDGRALQVRGNDDDLIAEVLQPGHRHEGRLASLEHVDQLGLGHAARDRLDLLHAHRRLDEDHIGARRRVGVRALHRRVEAFHGEGVGAAMSTMSESVMASRAARSFWAISTAGTTDLLS